MCDFEAMFIWQTVLDWSLDFIDDNNLLVPLWWICCHEELDGYWPKYNPIF